VQEALANAVRHAGASHIAVDVRFGDEVRIEVADDGDGFPAGVDVARLERGGGMGLIGMRERAAEAGGELRIASRPGRGTAVRVTVPVT
jgi:signal transduction histidine kinase